MGNERTVETATPLLEIVEEIQEAGGEVYKYCYQCGKCDVVCPWNRVRKFSIRKIIREASFGLTQELRLRPAGVRARLSVSARAERRAAGGGG